MAGETPIVLDKPRVLKFTIAAMERLELDMGCGLDELWAKRQRIAALIALLYHGLAHEDATLTKARIAKLLDRLREQGRDVSEIHETVLEALFASGVYGKRMAELAEATTADAADENPTPPAEPGG